MRIRAAVLEEFAKPLVVQDVELAEPGPGEVLVRLHACGVCHTDMYTASGVDPSGYTPTVCVYESKCERASSIVSTGTRFTVRSLSNAEKSTGSGSLDRLG